MYVIISPEATQTPDVDYLHPQPLAPAQQGWVMARSEHWYNAPCAYGYVLHPDPTTGLVHVVYPVWVERDGRYIDRDTGAYLDDPSW